MNAAFFCFSCFTGFLIIPHRVKNKQSNQKHLLIYDKYQYSDGNYQKHTVFGVPYLKNGSCQKYVIFGVPTLKRW
tara:strand:- start:56 stop:280 length:225 start_codon:yes stop_codon:yes gene_type:complete